MSVANAALTLDEIRNIFMSWRRQAEADEKLNELWNGLFDDLQTMSEQKAKQ